MPREARERSKTGIYHVVTRGVNQQNIFLNDKDKNEYIKRIQKYKNECSFQIYAYCLMDNHTHLLLKEAEIGVSKIMRKLTTSYVHYFNQEYGRTGPLFQDRYKSEPVEDDRYLLAIIRYIHQNPILIGKKISDWTSYGDYTDHEGITDTDFALKMFAEERKKALKLFEEYTSEANGDKYLDIMADKRLSDNEATKAIKDLLGDNAEAFMQNLDKKQRNDYIAKLKDIGLSIRQIERLTGVNRGVVLKV